MFGEPPGSGGSGEAWEPNGPNGCYKYTGSGFNAEPFDNKQVAPIYSDTLPAVTADATYLGQVGVSVNNTGVLNVALPESVSPNTYFSQHPTTIRYQSNEYTEQSDLSISLETHANGNVYARAPVTMVAVPYTAADSDQTAGTYEVSSQDGTTVSVSLKAMQDGGDAATVDGMTPVEAVLNLVYPVGSVYMSSNNVSPQTFLGGTWEAIQGQFLLAASSAYPAGSTGGAEEISLEADNVPQLTGSITNGTGIVWAQSDADAYLQTSDGTAVVANSSPIGVPGSTNQVGAHNTADVLISGDGKFYSNMPPYLAVYMWQRTA